MAASSSPVLVTGAAGFVGFHLSRRLLRDGRAVVGVDSVNAYYDPRLKEARLRELQVESGFRFVRLDLADRQATAQLFDDVQPDLVVHLAAQAGVRYSLEAPHAYTESNLVALGNVEPCQHRVRHLTFASSAGLRRESGPPFSEHHGATIRCPRSHQARGRTDGHSYS
jgi:UDP-glucuronate 4-epimerase